MGTNMSVIQYCTLFSLLLGNAIGSCPTSSEIFWAELGDSCYTISKSKMNMGQAQEYCWEQGGYLAEITSKDEEDLLDSFLVGGLHYWIGLTDIFVEGVWRWEQSHQEAEYTNWVPGSGSGGESYNCVWKNYNPAGPGWHDVDCSYSGHNG